MKETFIDTKDMAWLREVHWPELPAKYKFAVITGSEDAPDEITAYVANNITSKSILRSQFRSDSVHKQKNPTGIEKSVVKLMLADKAMWLVGFRFSGIDAHRAAIQYAEYLSSVKNKNSDMISPAFHIEKMNTEAALQSILFGLSHRLVPNMITAWVGFKGRDAEHSALSYMTELKSSLTGQTRKMIPTPASWLAFLGTIRRHQAYVI